MGQNRASGHRKRNPPTQDFKPRTASATATSTVRTSPLYKQPNQQPSYPRYKGFRSQPWSIERTVWRSEAQKHQKAAKLKDSKAGPDYTNQKDVEKDSQRPANDNVMVVVRVRPLLLKEMKRHQLNVIETAPHSTLRITRLADRSNPYLKSGKGARYDYQFDAAFGPNASQQEVWAISAAPLVDTILEGTNGTIFVYGATGTGKTYTMMGTDETSGAAATLGDEDDHPVRLGPDGPTITSPQPGIVQLTLRDLFHKIHQRTEASLNEKRILRCCLVLR